MALGGGLAGRKRGSEEAVHAGAMPNTAQPAVRHSSKEEPEAINRRGSAPGRAEQWLKAGQLGCCSASASPSAECFCSICCCQTPSTSHRAGAQLGVPGSRRWEPPSPSSGFPSDGPRGAEQPDPDPPAAPSRKAGFWSKPSAQKSQLDISISWLLIS